MVYVDDERARIAFAERAARRFQAHPEYWTFSDGELAPGELLALRWGLGDDCVLVLRIGEDTPVNYQQLVRTVADA
jgi:hypothetical protein